MVDNWEIRTPPAQGALGLNNHPLFSLLFTDPSPHSLCLLPSPLAPCLPFPSLCQGCSSAGFIPVLSLFKGRASCPWQLSCLFQRTRASTCHLWAPLAMGVEVPGLHPAWAFSSSSLVSHVLWDAGGAEGLGTAFPSSPGAHPWGGGGAQPAVGAPWQPEGGTLCTQECVNPVRLHKQG